jgi:hypothetical protein
VHKRCPVPMAWCFWFKIFTSSHIMCCLLLIKCFDDKVTSRIKLDLSFLHFNILLLLFSVHIFFYVILILPVKDKYMRKTYRYRPCLRKWSTKLREGTQMLKLMHIFRDILMHLNQERCS